MTARPRARLMLVLSAALVALAVGGAPGSAVLDAKPGRDMAAAAPESVGVSSERLKRLDAGMQGLVDDGKLAGAVTMLTRARQDGARRRPRREGHPLRRADDP